MDFLYGAAGGGVVGVIAVVFGLVVFGYFKRVIAERDTLQERRTATLERRFEEHISSDRSQEVLNEIKNISGNLERLSAQVPALLVSDSQQREQIATLFNRQSELREDIRSCRQEHKS